MNTRFYKALLAVVLPGILLAMSCKKESKVRPVVEDNPGDMKISFSYVWGIGNETVPFKLGELYVHPKTGDSLEFSTFRYYVSNIKLRDIDGNWWSHPESYALLDMSLPNGSDFNISGIPAGKYVEMQYTMGVDSAKNVDGVQVGALSLSNGMYWDWNSGYIMLKAEGYSPDAENGGYAFHLGGFSGTNNIITTLSTQFWGDTIVIKKGQKPTIKLQANPARLWLNAPSVSVRATIHMPGEPANLMAKDFYSGITYNGRED